MSTSTTNGSVRKTVCPVSRQQFQAGAKPLAVSIEGQLLQVPTKEFSTGSLGWYLNGKAVIQIDGKSVQVQLGLTVTVIGSKELPQ